MTALPRFCAVSLIAASLHAQGTTPKASPSDYPVHAAAGGVTLAAEYLVHAIPTPSGSFVARDYLVVEAAFFGPPSSRLNLSAEHFTLRINGRKAPVMTQSPGIVSASLKYPDWTQRPTLVGTAGMGDRAVIIGQPAPVERFPGDPTARRGPQAPRVPEPENPTGEPKEPQMGIEKRVQRAALPEGAHVPPASGLLFFPFNGKTKSLRSLELIYDGPLGKMTLKLL